MAAPYVGEIFTALAAYKQLPFDEQFRLDDTAKLVALPATTDLMVEEAVKLLEAAGFFVEVDGDGDRVTGSFPVVGTQIKVGEPVVLFT